MKSKESLQSLSRVPLSQMGFPGNSVVKNPPASAGDTGLITGLEDPLEEEMATHSSTFVWRIAWTEEPGRLQPMGSLKSQT